jgi:hypothetical protein
MKRECLMYTLIVSPVNCVGFERDALGYSTRHSRDDYFSTFGRQHVTIPVICHCHNDVNGMTVFLCTVINGRHGQ